MAAKRIVNLNTEYTKPEGVTVTIHGSGKFYVIESVIHSIMQTIGFKRDGGEVGDDFVTFQYKPSKVKKRNK